MIPEYKAPKIRIFGHDGGAPLLIAAKQVLSAGLKPVEGAFELYSRQGGVKLYQSMKSAIDHNLPVPRYSRTYVNQARLNISDNAPPLTMYFRPEDLEPANIEHDERIAFLLAQVKKWADRLLESGLSIHEAAVLCEDMMTWWGERMKQYEGVLSK